MHFSFEGNYVAGIFPGACEASNKIHFHKFHDTSWFEAGNMQPPLDFYWARDVSDPHLIIFTTEKSWLGYDTATSNLRIQNKETIVDVVMKLMPSTDAKMETLLWTLYGRTVKIFFYKHLFILRSMASIFHWQVEVISAFLNEGYVWISSCSPIG